MKLYFLVSKRKRETVGFSEGKDPIYDTDKFDLIEVSLSKTEEAKVRKGDKKIKFDKENNLNLIDF